MRGLQKWCTEMAQRHAEIAITTIVKELSLEGMSISPEHLQIEGSEACTTTTEVWARIKIKEQETHLLLAHLWNTTSIDPKGAAESKSNHQVLPISKEELHQLLQEAICPPELIRSEGKITFIYWEPSEDQAERRGSILETLITIQMDQIAPELAFHGYQFLQEMSASKPSTLKA